MENITITISDSKLKAKIAINESSDTYPTKTDIYRAIEKSGVVYGIDNSLIDRIIEEKHTVKDLVFARGDPPTEGKGARLVWYVNVSSALKPTITKEGKADFKKLKQFEAVKKGQELVSKLPCTEGKPGKSVMGDTIVSYGEDVAIPVGDNTIISDDGLTLYSGIDGYVFLKSGKIHIDSVCHIKGDVDFSTGNIKFDGTIFIGGDIRSGFRVDAKDSIFIEGNVEAANIYSERGDIYIQLGILGKGRAKVLAGGSLHCGFVQDATISVKKDIVIERYAINSSISSGGKVIINNNEGLIRGGNVFAEDGVEAIEVGSDHNKKTEIGISIDEVYGIDSEKWNINKQVEELKTKLSMLNKRIAFLSLLKERIRDLTDEKEAVLKNTIKEAQKIKEGIESSDRQMKMLREENLSRNTSKSIVVRNKLHRGVTITIGDQHFFAENLFQGVKIYLDGDKILVEDLPLEHQEKYYATK